MVPLGTLADVRDIGGPIFVNRYNLYTAASISGEPAARRQLGRGRSPTSTKSGRRIVARCR